MTDWINHFGADKILHFIVYFLLVHSFSCITFFLPKKYRSIDRFLTIGFTLSFIAIIDEYRQFPLVNRSTEFKDAIFSIVGIWTAIFALLVIVLVKQRGSYLYLKKKLLPIFSISALLFPLLLGLLLIDEHPKMELDQEEAVAPVFSYQNDDEPISLKQELYQIAFGKKDAVQTFQNNKEKVPADEILNKYKVYFQKLRLYASIKSESLFNEAVQEYMGRKEDESFSTIKYLKKYKDLGIGLSTNVDEVFNAIYKKLEAELQENGYSPKLAEPFLEEYNKEKRARVTTILKYLKEELL